MYPSYSVKAPPAGLPSPILNVSAGTEFEFVPLSALPLAALPLTYGIGALEPSFTNAKWNHSPAVIPKF